MSRDLNAYVCLRDAACYLAGDDAAIEHIHDLMDAPWRRLNEHERALVGRLPEPLWEVPEPTGASLPAAPPVPSPSQWKELSDWCGKIGASAWTLETPHFSALVTPDGWWEIRDVPRGRQVEEGRGATAEAAKAEVERRFRLIANGLLIAVGEKR